MVRNCKFNFITNCKVACFKARKLTYPKILQYKLRQIRSRCNALRTATRIQAGELRIYGQIPLGARDNSLLQNV